MRNIPIAEFKDHVSAYVAAAARGEEIVITRHGKEAARLLPPAGAGDERARRAKQALEKMAILREKMRADGRTSTIEEMIAWKNEGRP